MGYAHVVYMFFHSCVIMHPCIHAHSVVSRGEYATVLSLKHPFLKLIFEVYLADL